MQIKREIVPRLIKEMLGENAQYYMDSGLSLNDCLAIGIYKYPDRYHLSDYISSVYNNIPYEIIPLKQDFFEPYSMIRHYRFYHNHFCNPGEF